MKLYDNAYKSSYEELQTYYPVWYREVKEMDAIWRAEGKQYDEIRDAIIRGIDNNFVYWADAETISKWENFLYITYDSPRTLEARRAYVAALLAGGGHIGEPEIKGIVWAFTRSDCDVSLETGGGEGTNHLSITVRRGDTDALFMGDLDTVLGRKLPAHLQYKVFVRYVYPVVVETPRITRAINDYRLCGLYPEPALLGRFYGDSAGVETSADITEAILNYEPTSQDVKAGTVPHDILLAALRGADLEYSADLQKAIMDYDPASEEHEAGTVPDAALLAALQQAEANVSAGAQVNSAFVEYPPCGTTFAGQEVNDIGIG